MLTKFDEPFSKEGFASILTGIEEIQSGILFLENAHLIFVSENLKELWKPQLQKPELQVFYKRVSSYEKKPVWLISLSNQFTKDIQNIDRRLQLAIL